MPPTDRFAPCFAAEPPQDPLPYGRWAQRLQREFLAACLALDDEDADIGEAGEPAFHPDRTWNGRTYVPVTAQTSTGLELFGFVSYLPATSGRPEPEDFQAWVDFTDETAARNPDWKVDLADEVIGRWRGENERVAQMTLVWGRTLVDGGAIVTAELTRLVVDQCDLLEDRFTLIAPDDYRGDTLEVVLWDRDGRELARESLYAEESGEGDED